MKTLLQYLILQALALCLFLTGCATAPEPFDYHPDNELKPGPGLISGQAGVFTIYRKHEVKTEEAQKID